MSESQSRYSIVENLTEKKLDIITAIANLDSDVKLAKQTALELTDDLKDWEASQVDEVKRIKRDKLRAIKQANTSAKNAEDKKVSKEKAYKEKIKAIDEALNKIQAISDASAKEANK